MPKPIKPIHVKAVGALAIYFVCGNLILWSSVFREGFFPTYVPTMLYGAISSAAFLFIFSHEDFFKFAKVIEKIEEKMEKRWLGFLSHAGRVFTSFIVGTLTGAVLGALTIRFLLPKASYRYLLAFLVGALSGIFVTTSISGLFSFVFN